jgi:hypothetical protein
MWPTESTFGSPVSNNAMLKAEKEEEKICTL